MTDLYSKFKFPQDNIWPKSGNDDKPIPPYIFDDKIRTIIKVALVTQRPLLITGSPGSGKTSLAKSIAAFQDWNYLKYTFTSRSRLEELTGEIDQLQRLHDAHLPKKNDSPLMEAWAYYKPGVFWWAYDPESALRKGGKKTKVDKLGEKFRTPEIPANFDQTKVGNVVLLDEIDKAEPDLPNDLLEPLDKLSFHLPDVEQIASKGLAPLVIITSNGERELPPAFLRRCITLELPDPKQDMLVTIAEHHLNQSDEDSNQLFSLLAKKFSVLSKEAKDNQRRQPGTSEYLDAVKACLKLDISPDVDDDSETARTWQLIKQATLLKTSSDDN